MFKFRPKDLSHIHSHELTPEKIKTDLDCFHNGFETLQIIKPATLNDGILKLSETDIQKYSQAYDQAEIDVTKFVPSSGAASRMFKDLHHFVNKYDKQQPLKNNLIASKLEHLLDFFEHIQDLPFYAALIKKMGLTKSKLTSDEEKFEFIKAALSYSDLPKALIPFHNYGQHLLSAFEEHFFEAAEYASQNGVSKLHFTISELHREKFDQFLVEKTDFISEYTGVKFEVDFSCQSRSTDTVAVKPDLSLYRDENGKLLFRPAGHGALISNLKSIDSDLIFIKNIDNVHYKPGTEDKDVNVSYKKALAGLCLDFEAQIKFHIKNLKNQATESQIKAAQGFVQTHFQNSVEENVQCLLEFLEKPIRVCGMVKNEGEPGGGPFWVKTKDGEMSLQIVEKSQIDLQNGNQVQLMEGATHFNPVDIVCSIKDVDGNNYKLEDFVDYDQGFIADKSVDGQPIKALELPGLWNGGMADWHTIFIEVPVETFNPVKTVADLLKPRHQSYVEIR
ncbi:MAG: DUF4301 family protein [Psychroflexus sp.]|nr:DUF4301 family protein [Psychroflexus sp.]